MNSVKISNGETVHNHLNGSLKLNGSSNGHNLPSNGIKPSINGESKKNQLDCGNSPSVENDQV